MNLRTAILLLGFMLYACTQQVAQRSQLQTIDTLQIEFGNFQYAAPITDSFPKHFATEFLLQGSAKSKPIIKTERALSAIRGDTSAFFVDPQSDRFSLIMFHSNGQIDTFNLKAFKAPPPQILLRIDSQYVKPSTVINLDNQKSVSLEFKMPERLEYYYPKDCRYEVRKGTAVLQSESNRRSIPIINNSVDLKAASEGDQLILEIDTLIRRNYRNEVQLINSDRIKLEYKIRYGA